MIRSLKINFIDVMILLFCTSMYIFALESRFTIVFRVISIALIFVLFVYAWNKKEHFKIGSYVKTFLAFLLVAMVTVVWAKDNTRAISRVITISECFLVIILLYNYLSKEKKANFFLFSMTCSVWFYGIYILAYYGWSDFIRMIQDSERVGSELTNVNTIGVSMAFGAILTLWYILFEKRYAFIAPFMFCSAIAVSTASKKVILCLVIGFFLLYTLRVDDKKRFRKLLTIPIACIAIYFLLQLPIFDNVLYRFQRFMWTFNGEGRGDGSTYARWNYITIGFEEFLKRPLWGVGIGCSGWITNNYVGKWTYLHNNYIELLASIGIVGTIVFYRMYYIPLIYTIKKKIVHSKYTILAFSIIVLRLINHLAAVEYYDKVNYMFLLLVTLLVENVQAAEKLNNPQITKTAE